MMADPESTSCVSPSDVESISGGKGGEFEVDDPFSEGTSTDLLKNTPSNIAKLEDIIEHSEGRKKYLAHTKSPSDGEDVRWYFCKVPLAENQLAASVPRTEIVGKSEYFRFGMRDSLALEASFLQCEEDLLAMWWKEYAECSEGPSGSCVSSNTVLVTQLQSSPDGKRPSIIVEDEQERVGVPVKGGLYEVDLVKRHCFPVYWHGENRRVLRGHWFACKGGHEWLPLRENVSEQLELAYRCQVWRRRSYQTSGLFAARVELQGSVQGLHALFTGEDETWEAWLASETSGFSNVISLRGNGIKLRRGYSSSQSSRPSQDELRQQKEEQADDYCSQVPVGHLVFMVHGIGQRLEKANLVDDVATFRHITSSLAERHLTAYQRSSQRVLFIPCQWRRGLKLDGESSVEKITLDGVRGLRQTLSATVHDVLYYMSPIYCQAIINSVSNQLNKLYAKFIKRNPGYGGKVSIYGHSLGSVLSYDILCHQEILSSPFPMENVCGKYGFSGNPQLCKGPVSSGFNPTPCPNDLGATKIYQAPEHVGCFLSESDCPQSDLKVHSPAISNSSMDEPRVCHGEAVDVVQMNSSVSDVRGLDENHALDNKHEHNRSSILDAKGVEEDHHSDNVYQQHDEGPEFRLKMQSEAHDGTKALVGDISVNEHDKDQLITMLTEQVILLEKRLKDLTVQQNHILAQEKKAYVTGDMISVAASRMPSSGEGSSDQDDTQNTYTPIIKYTKLDFKVDTFFAVGSPLGVFLSLRNIRIGIGEGKEYWQGEEIIEEMPACRRMFNIFHPFDPVAYRIEPLVCKEYIGKRPVIIPYHRGGKRLHIGFQEFTEDLAARSQAVLRRVNSMRIHMVNIFQPKKSIEDDSTDTNYEKNKTYGAIMMKRLTGSEEGHIDHMLQDETFQHPFILAIGSHTSYWRDFDTALFILKHLYNDIPEEPMTDPSTGLPQLANVTKTATYETDAMDQEDLPLTFSDIDLRLAFSRRARKFTAT